MSSIAPITMLVAWSCSGGRLGADTGRHADQCSGEVARQRLEICRLSDIAGTLRVTERIRERPGDPLQVCRCKSSACRVKRGSLDGGITHQASFAAGPALAGRCISGERVADRIKPRVWSLDGSQDAGEVLVVLAFRRRFEQLLF